MLTKLKPLKKPLIQKRRRSCDFPPRKTPVAQKHRAISRQEKMAFSTPSGCPGTPLPLPQSLCGRTDGRTYGCTDGRSRDYYVTTKISRIDRLPNFLSNGAPLAGFARRLRYYYYYYYLYSANYINMNKCAYKDNKRSARGLGTSVNFCGF